MVVCPYAFPVKTERRMPKIFSWGTSFHKWVVGCKKRLEKCNITCPDYVFYNMKVLDYGYRKEVVEKNE